MLNNLIKQWDMFKMNVIHKFRSRILVLICTMSLFAILMLYTSIDGIPSVEAKYVFSKKWGTYGSENGKFYQPRGVAVSPSGTIYVVDSGNHRIQVFKLASPCPSGTTQVASGVCFVRAWGTAGNGNGQFIWPRDIALDSSGRVYVADTENHRIQMFKGNGDFIRAWSISSSTTPQFENVADVAIDSSNNDIYVTEGGKQKAYIHKFRIASPCPSGTTQAVPGVCLVAKWTLSFDIESPNIKYYNLAGIGVNPSTHEVFVSQVISADGGYLLRIMRFSSDGNSLGTWGTVGYGNGQFNSPRGVAVSALGDVYVSEPNNNRIQVFKLASPCPSGTTQVASGVCFFTKWGTQGTANGQVQFPDDVTIGGPLENVYVADTANHRIQAFYWKSDVGGPGGDGTSPNIAVK
jgi:NHL repeat-containing protein